MNHTEFLAQAKQTLGEIHDALEPHYDDGALEELEMQGGILTIQNEAGQTVVVNIHEASMQIWLASPLSGGVHFDFEQVDAQWKARDGKELLSELNLNLQELAGISLTQ